LDGRWLSASALAALLGAGFALAPVSSALAAAPYACRQDIHPNDPAYPGVHVASVEQAPNGDLLYAFYAGTAELNNDVKTYLARLPVGSRNWTAPRVVFDEPNKPDGNAVLWNNGHGRLYLFMTTIMGKGWTQGIIRYISSDDNGVTWTNPTMMHSTFGWVLSGKVLDMSNGSALLPMYSEVDWRPGWYLSGNSFQTFAPVPSANPADWPHSPNGSIQAIPVELEKGHILTYMRTKNDGWIYQSESRDYGHTWSAATQTNFPNPNARISLYRAKNGHLFLAYNPSFLDRTVLRLAMSEDNGATWPYAVDAENLGLSAQEVSYPYISETTDGMLQMGYTHRRLSMRHLVFNEEWIKTSSAILPVGTPVSSGSSIPSDPSYTTKYEYSGGSVHTVDNCSYAPSGTVAAATSSNLPTQQANRAATEALPSTSASPALTLTGVVGLLVAALLLAWGWAGRSGKGRIPRSF